MQTSVTKDTIRQIFASLLQESLKMMIILILRVKNMFAAGITSDTQYSTQITLIIISKTK